VLTITGKSYRLRDRAVAAAETTEKTLKPANAPISDSGSRKRTTAVEPVSA
jgi:hypothetical protein